LTVPPVLQARIEFTFSALSLANSVTTAWPRLSAPGDGKEKKCIDFFLHAFTLCFAGERWWHLNRPNQKPHGRWQHRPKQAQIQHGSQMPPDAQQSTAWQQ
jgi:hypothetical protein